MPPRRQGLIDTKQGRDAFIRTDRTDVALRIGIDPEDPQTSLVQMLELRLGLVAEIPALAAVRRTCDQTADIQRALYAIDEASAAGRDAAAKDLEFRLSIVQATRNSFFFEMIRFLGSTFYNGIAVTRAKQGRREALGRQTRVEHERITASLGRCRVLQR